MKRISRLFVLGTLLLSACGVTPATPLPVPSSTATLNATQTPERDAMPEVLFEITNEPDALQDPYGVAVNSDGKLYVSDAGHSRVLIFDNTGKLITKWDAHGSDNGQFNSFGFGGLVIDSNDNVFVVDNGNHRIQKFDKAGNFLLAWGSEGSEDGQFVRAIGIAIDSEDNVYVTDDGNPFVQKFDNSGSFLMKWGGLGSDDGQFTHATGIAVDAEGNVYVADYQQKRVQKFDPPGSSLRSGR